MSDGTWHQAVKRAAAALGVPEVQLSRLSRRTVPIGLICAGLLLLLYVATQYGHMYFEQRRLAERWAQEQQDNAAVPASQSSHAAVGHGIIRLVIPKIDLTSFVVEGTNHNALLLGPGHMKDTVEPGDIGNAVISAHRDTFFRHIHELDKGDQIYVDRGGKRFVYEVTGKKIVDPDDVSVTKPSSESQLTLITCYPTYYIGPAPKRLVVFTKLSGDREAKLADTDKDSIKPKLDSQAGH
ncbi:MAG: class D sortase [Terriglobales bacterium]